MFSFTTHLCRPNLVSLLKDKPEVWRQYIKNEDDCCFWVLQRGLVMSLPRTGIIKSNKGKKNQSQNKKCLAYNYCIANKVYLSQDTHFTFSSKWPIKVCHKDSLFIGNSYALIKLLHFKPAHVALCSVRHYP